MGWKDLFKKKEKDADPFADLTLDKLKTGYILDYDMQTWQVTAHHYYDWGGGEITHEWQLKGVHETIYLDMDQNDETEWTISHKIHTRQLGESVDQIRKQGHPPDKITYQEDTFFLEEDGDGSFYENSKGPLQKFHYWDYENGTGDRFLTIERWDQNKLEASLGQSVQEYQFTDILPGRPI